MVTSLYTVNVSHHMTGKFRVMTTINTPHQKQQHICVRFKTGWGRGFEFRAWVMKKFSSTLFTSLHRCIQTGSRAQSASYLMGTGGSLSWR